MVKFPLKFKRAGPSLDDGSWIVDSNGKCIHFPNADESPQAEMMVALINALFNAIEKK